MKIRLWLQMALVYLCACLPCGCSEHSSSTGISPAQDAVAKPALPADSSLSDRISEINSAGKYAFVLFHSDENQSVARLRETINSIKGKLEAKAVFLEAKTGSPTVQSYVTKYNLDRAPMPLLMAFAQNGVAVRALQAGCSTEDIEKSFVSPKAAEVSKAIQEGKNTLLLFGNDGLEGFRDSLLSANKVALVWPNLRIIVVDPTDPEEKNLLEQSVVSSKTNRSVLVVLSTTGTIGARIEGKVTEKEITDAVNSCRSQCG
jgi:hypothetical protein